MDKAIRVAAATMISVGVLVPCAGAIWYLFGDAPWEKAIFLLLIGIFLLVASKIETITELSFGPIKAKMIAQINEAAATIEQVRAINGATARTTLAQLISSYFFLGGVTLSERLSLAEQIIRALRTLGLTDREIADVREPWDRGIETLYFLALKRELELTMRGQTNWKELEADWNANAQEGMIVAPSKTLRATLAKYDALTPEVQRWLDELEHYRATKNIRHPEELVSKVEPISGEKI